MKGTTEPYISDWLALALYVEPLLVPISLATDTSRTYFSSSKNRIMFLRCFQMDKYYTKFIMAVSYLKKEETSESWAQ